MDADLPYFVAFSMFPGIGPVRFQLLYDYFSSAKNAWSASSGELVHIGLGAALTERFCRFRKTVAIDSLVEELDRARVTALPFYDERYPILLAAIPDRPFVLYVKGYRGKLPINLSDTVAVVGTRKVTRYGAQVTQEIAGDLARAGVTVVTGLAYGVDAIAHKAALDSGGATIAEQSGSLITARYAAEQGRDVFAVPGSITNPYSKGPSKLIRDGATLITSARDILDAVGIRKGKSSPGYDRSNLSTDEQTVCRCLSRGDSQVDAIVRESGLTASRVTGILTVFEMRGIARNIGENTYSLTVNCE